MSTLFRAAVANVVVQAVGLISVAIQNTGLGFKMEERKLITIPDPQLILNVKNSINISP